MRYYQRTELITKLKEVALLEGDFLLRSGKRSKYYLDKYLFEGIPSILRSLAHHMARLVPEDITRLAGVELGGIPVVTALSMETDIPCIFVRKQAKDHGQSKLVEGVYEPGDRVLMIEDVVTTGGQLIEMIGYMKEQMGLSVVGVIAVLDRNEGSRKAFAELGLPFNALFSREDLGF
ncbi:MAG: orotate phosphoribosyltransferase [Candidatus Riflebacteria bacterium RBG_13_59_9]|nr:MAG: orotate phosphoribosyltransferase [Candidatus Riflebacteria bacterium RBG_13_59_9]